MDGVIFDNDGVVVDSEQLANRVCAEVLTDLGWPCTYEYSIEHFLGTSLAAVRDHVERLAGRGLDADFERRYHDRLFAEFDLSLSAVPGIADALDSLDSPICMASSGDHNRIRYALDRCGLRTWFDGHIYSAQDVARGKPEPDLFLFAAASEGWDPARCVVIEDSPFGVQAAKSAGMAVIGFARVTPAERLSAADVVIRDMANVVEALNSLML